jgi:hypothetical protein
MNYKDIPTFQQRLKDAKPTSEAEMHVVLLEEIAELRHYIEWYLLPKQQQDFSKVKTITVDGRCLDWDGQEVNMAP